MPWASWSLHFYNTLILNIISVTFEIFQTNNSLELEKIQRNNWAFFEIFQRNNPSKPNAQAHIAGIRTLNRYLSGNRQCPDAIYFLQKFARSKKYSTFAAALGITQRQKASLAQPVRASDC